MFKLVNVLKTITTLQSPFLQNLIHRNINEECRKINDIRSFEKSTLMNFTLATCKFQLNIKNVLQKLAPAFKKNYTEKHSL